MNLRPTLSATSLLLIYCILFCPLAALGQEKLKYPDLSTARGTGQKGADVTAKLSSDLRILFDQYSSVGKGAKGAGSGISFSDEELREMYGISGASDNPTVSLAVTITAADQISSLKENGMKVFLRKGNVVYGQAPVRSLSNLASERSVVTISATKTARIPELPITTTPDLLAQLAAPATPKGARSAPDPLANEFNKSALTGKGIIVGVIDSGIDWRHPDFTNADGTSRILAIWDMFDDSFTTSSGKTGSSPPKLDPAGEPLFGTVYTKAQIDAALKGVGTVNTVDNNGHGTAVAGTAAGNGRASTIANAGVAPEADLIIVKASDCDGFTNHWVYGAVWITQIAQALNRPVVVNGSFGGHYSAHDGKDSEEELLNKIAGAGKPGVVFTISAGNEGRSSMHATGRFGPKRAGQQDVTSSPISVTISRERTQNSYGRSILLGLFDARDDWAVAVVPSASSALLDKNGKPMIFFLIKAGVEVKWTVPEGLVPPDGFADLMNSVLKSSQLGTTIDLLPIALPYGSYDIYGLSTSDKVVSGTFDFYAPRNSQADFGRGTTKTGMVGSPGNAANVITVGAYNFRKNWVNMSNTQTAFNLPIGRLSDYSSPGGRRRGDGVVKPDIVAPASYTISPLSQTAGPESRACDGDNMGAASGPNYVTRDGKYIAWQGTSASAPFTAGVIALLLQKNPSLDAAQIRQILIKSARSGGDIGAVPNPEWGYGMLDPGAAIKATPPKQSVPLK